MISSKCSYALLWSRLCSDDVPVLLCVVGGVGTAANQLLPLHHLPVLLAAGPIRISLLKLHLQDGVLPSQALQRHLRRVGPCALFRYDKVSAAALRGSVVIRSQAQLSCEGKLTDFLQLFYKPASFVCRLSDNLCGSFLNVKHNTYG